MTQAPVEVSHAMLEARLERGARLLFDMEQRGDTGSEYDGWLQGWVELLYQYEGQASERTEELAFASSRLWLERN